MTSTNIYLDESGDLGWTFDSPYRRGGSSRYLTIASLIVSPEKKHLPKRMIKKLYQKFNWDPQVEKKWSDMTIEERTEFATRAKRLVEANPDDIKYVSITVRKQNVQAHIRTDANKLYNYMISLSLVKHMKLFDNVTFIPDPRSVKVESGNSLHDYLQTALWFQESVSTVLKTQPIDSSACTNLQFADMLSGIVQGHFEDSNSEPWRILSPKISYNTLFF
ncbi:DUF3800 domain-containing protein [Vibrio parahaemolyticus]|uniref:DUF3800 domain-containing protein n=2 Tax=Vibrio parahaemolyticus TaxID=670 RepID=UPI002ACD497D|nr:DUF3800 domain-containing protein [Vibrio parahaemolyticus]